MSKQNKTFNPLDWANNSVNNGAPDGTCKGSVGWRNALNGRFEETSGSLGRFNGSVGASPCDPSAERGAQLAHGAHQCAPSSPAEDFEQLLTAIESSGIDLTNDYNDWYKIGIAIASEFGESGRDYFHRISKLYSSYNYKEVDKKYSQCISDPNPSITISTIYYLAKNAGITLPQKTQSAKDASASLNELSTLYEQNIAKIDALARNKNIKKLFLYINEYPIIDISKSASELGLSYNTLLKAVNMLKELDILILGDESKSRNKLYFYEKYLEILRRDTQIL